MTNNKSTRPGKRAIYIAPLDEKLRAVRRVLDGETKAQVIRASGIPGGTLRGWCKKTELCAMAMGIDINATPPPVAPLVPMPTYSVAPALPIFNAQLMGISANVSRYESSSRPARNAQKQRQVRKLTKKKSTKSGKREVYLAPLHEKLRAVRRVLNGETKAQVRRAYDIPEGTLRGWCKKTELCAMAEGVATNATPPPVAPLVPMPTHGYNKTKTNSKNGASTSRTTKSPDKSSIEKKSANRGYKIRTVSGSENDSGVADLSDASKNSSINKTKRATKRKRTHTESTDEDYVPAERRIVDLESRSAKDLLYDLFAGDSITRDTFVYLYEMIKSLEF